MDPFQTRIKISYRWQNIGGHRINDFNIIKRNISQAELENSFSLPLISEIEIKIKDFLNPSSSNVGNEVVLDVTMSLCNSVNY